MLKIKDNIDLKELEKFGFIQSKRYISPKALERLCDINCYIRIFNDKPCINIWDGEDKNRTREIWLENDKLGIGSCTYDAVEKHIKDLIQAGLVEKVGDK